MLHPFAGLAAVLNFVFAQIRGAGNNIGKQRVKYQHNGYYKQYLQGKKAKTMPDGYAYHKCQRSNRINFGGYQHTWVKVFEFEYADNAKQHKYRANYADNVTNKYMQVFQLLLLFFA